MSRNGFHPKATEKGLSMTTGYFDQSYPPSLFVPPVVPVQATGATAGIPGVWTPPGSVPPVSQLDAINKGIVASPLTPWTAGQYVQTGTAGAAGRISWSGTAWVGGAAPAVLTTPEPGSEYGP